MENAITVRDLKIRYKSVGSYSIKRNLLHLNKIDSSMVEAVKGVSFDVKEGEYISIIGPSRMWKIHTDPEICRFPSKRQIYFPVSVRLKTYTKMVL